MTELRLAQVVVTEGQRDSLISKGIARFTGSWATHVFISGWGSGGVEAWLPKVKPLDVAERLEELRSQDRAYVVLDLPSLTIKQRMAIVAKAESYIGRYYDVGQILLFALTGKFWSDGPGTLVCSRLITAAYFSGAEENLFDDLTLGTKYPLTFPRIGNLRRGYAVPSDLLNSRLEVVQFVPSSHIKSIEQFRL